jgi:hypothetical protein
MLQNLDVSRRRFGIAAADERSLEVEISRDALEIARLAVQTVVDPFKWAGPRQRLLR